MDTISTRGPYTHLWWCTAGECVQADPAVSLTAPLIVPVHTMNNQSFIYSFMDSKNLFLNKTMALQLRGGAHRRLLSAVRRPAGAGGWKRDPRSSSAGEEDETAEEEHAAGEGGLAGGGGCHVTLQTLM